MAKYSCRFLNKAKRIDDVEMIESDSDKVAQARALFFFDQRDFPHVELWLQDRLVFRRDKEPNEDAAAPEVSA